MVSLRVIPQQIIFNEQSIYVTGAHSMLAPCKFWVIILIIITIFIDHLLFALHPSKNFSHINSFNPHTALWSRYDYKPYLTAEKIQTKKLAQKHQANKVIGPDFKPRQAVPKPTFLNTLILTAWVSFPLLITPPWRAWLSHHSLREVHLDCSPHLARASRLLLYFIQNRFVISLIAQNVSICLAHHTWF